ncbi:MAG: hypothetical protein LBH79_03060 [Nitrososphaerota archaeon]|jgi:hypothetical protein|nr:hypothetical protein [Nitrososphaerota archaeon]
MSYLEHLEKVLNRAEDLRKSDMCPFCAHNPEVTEPTIVLEEVSEPEGLQQGYTACELCTSVIRFRALVESECPELRNVAAKMIPVYSPKK